ncbi:DUF2889 domain-containing protein [Phenylobacterium sp. LjRoot225]|uniref:hypothetical protein n=1 Tax=Phenylobacterium sp. LjRoot225 TaxID=3342285 RepID=UPI003ECF0D96
MAVALDDLPGYRRRFRVTAGPGWVRSDLEDDYHHMHVTLRHQGGVVTAVEPVMVRAPWTTCPGAVERLKATFTGAPLADVPGRNSDKATNCTHLHDLATLAATHAFDREPLTYDILTSDPVDGRRRIELRRNGEPVMTWVEQDGRLAEPAAASGLTLLQLRPFIESLDAEGQERARILRWGAIVAHGRAIPLENQSDATRMPPTCFTFQPENKVKAARVGEIRDFSKGTLKPLEPRTGA